MNTKSYKTKLKISSPFIKGKLKEMAGAYRKIYNLCLNLQIDRIVDELNPKNYFIDSNRLLKIVLSQKETMIPFIDKMDSGILYAAVALASKTFKATFDYHYDNIPFMTKKRSTLKFKTKGKIKVFSDSLYIPKLGKIKLYEKNYLPVDKKIKDITFSCAGGDWFVSLEVSEPKPEVTLTENVVSLDFTKDGAPILNGKELPNIVNSEKYKSLERAHKSLSRKLYRQRKHSKYSRNMQKTMRGLDKLKNKMYNVRRDSFKKLVNGVAITKPKQLQLLSTSTIKATRNGYLGRELRRSGAHELLNMLKKKLRMMGTEIITLNGFLGKP